MRSGAQPVNPYRKQGVKAGGVIIKTLPHAPQARSHTLRAILLWGLGMRCELVLSQAARQVQKRGNGVNDSSIKTQKKNTAGEDSREHQ